MNLNILKDMISESSQFDMEKKYWLSKFSGELTKSCLPYDFITNNGPGFIRDTIEFKVPGDLFAKLNHLTNRSDNNLFVVLAAGLTVLLSKYTGNEDMVIGMPILKQEMEGEFLNVILALRNQVNPTMKLKEFLLQVKQTVKEANDHSNYPVERLQYYLGLENLDSGTSLFETVILLQNIHERKYIEKMNHNMVFLFQRSERFIAGKLEYNSRLYRRETVGKVVNHLLELLQNMICDLSAPISAVDILSGKEREMLLAAFNNTHVVYPGDKLFHELFAERVEKNPGNKAAVSMDVHSGKKDWITYTRLNERTNLLARFLAEKRVGADTIVGIMIEPCLDMAVAIMAVLKAGGAFLPMDPESPGDRIQYLLRESNCGILLTQDPFMEKINFAGEKINIKDESLCTGNNSNPEWKSSPQDLFYTIYTSGTTGRPKGGLLTHRNLVNYVTWFSRAARLTAKDRTILTSSYAFDLGYSIFLGSLLTGGELHILPKEMYMNAEKLLNYIKDNRISYLKMTPSLFTLVANSNFLSMETCSTLRLMVLGGEEINTRDVETVHNICGHIQFMNHYGPTETTIGSVARFIDFNCFEEYKTNPTIGKPVHNTHVYILDNHMNLAAAGIPGELFIGGDSVGRGYLNMPETSSRKFISHPLLNGECIYRTGDLARWLPDGNIQFLGREDNQVKIRGYRVELGEIENQISKSEEVKEVTVIAKEDKGTGRHLCAYIVPSSRENSFNITELKDFLSGNLPDFMMPLYWVPIDRIPLTPNGKLDRKALPSPQFEQVEKYIAPRDETEKALVDLWSESLNIKKELISVDSNFFNLGGHSLGAAVLAAKIHQILQVKVPIVKVFEKPTIEDLAEYIKGMSKETLVSISPTEKKEYYSLSSAQTRLYILQQMDLESTVYHISIIVELEGIIVMEKLNDIFRMLVDRHESLRSSFEMAGEKAAQRVHDTVEFEVNYHAQTGNGRGGPGEIIDNFIHPFNLSRAPLLRVNVIKTGKERNLLMMDMHHIIADGISLRLLIKDFLALYNGRGLPALRVQYKEYSEWQQNPALKKSLKKQEDFWLNECGEQIPVLDLPTDYIRPVIQSFEGTAIDFTLDPGEVKALIEIGEPSEATVFMVLMALYNIFLSKITCQDDIIIGTDTAGRSHPDLEPIIGMFVNSLPLRNFPAPGKTFNRFLQEVKEKSLKALENQDYQFENLVEKVSVNRDTSRNPIFDVFFSFMDRGPHGFLDEIEETKDSPLKIKPYRYASKTAKFDLMLNARQEGENLFFSFEYCTKLFNKKTINRFINYFKQTAARVIADPNRVIAAIEIISSQEKQQVLLEFNDTAVEYPRDKTISQLFAEQVERTPDSLALVGAHELHEEKAIESQLQITYTELNEKTDQVAHWLREEGVQPDTIVGIMMERSIEMMIGILGILNAGNAYLPIDPDYPRERIYFMLKDSNAGILLTTRRLSGKTGIEGGVIYLDGMQWEGPAVSHPEATGTFSNAAYIMYTSGTTGGPKGVMVTQRNVVRLVKNTDYIELTEKTRILQTGAPVFDATTFEIWGSLLNGGQLVLTGKEAIMDVRQLGKILDRYGINTLWLSAPLLNQLLDYDTCIFSSLDYLLVGGDVLSSPHINRVRRAFPGLTVINGYGPTENTTFSTAYHIREEFEGSIPIGKPIANSTVYIVNRNGHLQPIGVSGELLVGGDGVSCGYINSPELTVEKFDHDLWDYQDYHDENQKFLRGGPGGAVFSKSAPPGRRRQNIYRTGDLARWLPDGNIEFLGRMDHQVKIRGFRIELEEIENQLLTHGNIKEAIVMTREENNNDKYLCAYIVAKPGETNPIDQSGLREYLSNHLPYYMVPSYFVQLNNIPLTPNGKVDRKALLGPEMKTGENYTAPRNEIEKKLVDIWSEILDVEKEKIGINDNFFHLGGHSLKATALAARIHNQLNINVLLTEIFKTPHIHGLAAYIKEAARSKHIPVEPVEKKEYYPLSSTQRRLYILQQMDAEKGIAYNMPSVWQLEGDLDIEKFETVFHRVIQRHDSLRTFLTMVNDEPVQRIEEEVKFKVENNQVEVEVKVEEAEQATDDRGQRTEERIQTTESKPETYPSSVVRHLSSEFIRPFDLSKAPLLRMGLIRIHKQKHTLMVDIHHIISDGMSMGILIKDFIELYAGMNLSGLRLQYKDYSEWHNRKAEGKFIKEQPTYWLKQFEGEVPVLDLPADYLRPSMQSFAGRTLHFEINREETAALKSLAHEQDVTLFMLLLSVYTIFLCKLSGQEDIVVGTPIAGRRHTDLESIIGMFVNTLALRNFPVPQKTFSQFLVEIKENTIKAFENQDYLYEYLVEQVVLERDTGRNPLFDVMFALQNVDIPAVEIPGLKVLPYDYEKRISKFDLTLTAIEIEDRLAFTFEYCTHLFKKKTIQRFTGFFKKTVSFVLENDKTRIAAVDIITREEKKRILQDFNNTSVEYPREKTIHQLFAEQVEQRPYQVALVGSKSQIPNPSGNISITYQELNNQSDRLARILTGKGVKSDIIVGIMVERSIEMIIGILGILKASGAYLPIDPDYPEERISYMLADSNAKILLITKNISKAINFEKEMIDLNSSSPQASLNLSEGRLFNSHHSSFINHHSKSLAYIMYTSGTSGGPKGVLVTQRNVVRLVKNTNYIELKEKTRILQTGAPVFDATTFEIWGSLLNGGQLLLTGKEAIMDAQQLGKILDRFHINTLWLSAPLFNQLLDYDTGIFSSLDYLLVGGDVLSTQHINRLRRALPGLTVINGYGPTENTTFSTTYHIREEFAGSIPIGKPIANSTAYIVDRNGHLQPIGVSGELLVGGDGVSCGYINNPELTNSKFQTNSAPFKHHMHPCNYATMQSCNHASMQYRSIPPQYPITPSPHSPIYLTGDLGRWLPDGNIQFLGRLDHQVKIRGFRIELEEIESQLSNYSEIKEAVASVREDEREDKCICAYIVSSRELSISGLQNYLSKTLPNYMIPSFFVYIDKIPLTPNGKVDRRALPEPEIKTGVEYIAPGDDIEAKLVQIWSEILGIEKTKVSIKANFFVLGGHSLKANIMAARVYKELNVQLPMAEIFKTPTVRGLSGYIKGLTRDKYVSIEPVEKKEYYHLSSTQRRLYFLQRMDPGNKSYNIPVTLLLDGEIGKGRVREMYRQVICRHESFRTSFHMVNEEPVQRIPREVDFEVEYHEAEEGSEQFKKILKSIDCEFDLGRAPLFKIWLIKVGPGKHILVNSFHHIIIDGVSLGIMVDELMAIYKREQLSPLKVQYKDYADWQSRKSQQDALKKQEAYWLREFSAELPLLNLHTDYVRPEIFIFKGDTVQFKIDTVRTRSLNKLALEEGATLYMVLLTIYTVFLSKITGQEDIIVGSSVTCRQHENLLNVIGMFVNALAMRNYPASGKTFLQFFREVKKRTLEAFNNQDYQFEDLVHEVIDVPDHSRNPIFDVMFVLNNEEIPQIELPGLKLTPYQYDEFSAQMDLKLRGREMGSEILFSLEFATKLFKKETIEMFITNFKEVISAVLEEPELQLKDINISHGLLSMEPSILEEEQGDFVF